MYKFIDLFAGLGGFRQAFTSLGAECVFSSDHDSHVQKTYFANYGEMPFGDITKLTPSEVPDHDILCAGFPCQPFSKGGESTKEFLGQLSGFECKSQGTLFFNLKEIIKAKRPKAFFLENVKNLISHDKGETFKVIKEVLEGLDYTINWNVVDGGKWLPQHRERTFIVGYCNLQNKVAKEDIIIPSQPDQEYIYPELSSIVNKHVQGYTLGEGTWEFLQRHSLKHKERGNGFGYTLHTFPISEGEYVRTISARYHKDGSEAIVEQVNNIPRKLTIEELKQLFGYPEEFVFPVSRTQAYRQLGNSVIVPAILDTAKQIINTLENA
jgi:DNA (cytosine-5)-methyltransferase 1